MLCCGHQFFRRFLQSPAVAHLHPSVGEKLVTSVDILLNQTKPNPYTSPAQLEPPAIAEFIAIAPEGSTHPGVEG
jgi:hypothetical protein